jgi:hypothetical protein
VRTGSSRQPASRSSLPNRRVAFRLCWRWSVCLRTPAVVLASNMLRAHLWPSFPGSCRWPSHSPSDHEIDLKNPEVFLNFWVLSERNWSKHLFASRRLSRTRSFLRTDGREGRAPPSGCSIQGPGHGEWGSARSIVGGGQRRLALPSCRTSRCPMPASYFESPGIYETRTCRTFEPFREVLHTR